MHRTLLTIFLLVTALLLGGIESRLPTARAARAAARCFAETSFCVEGRFLAYWEAHGGLTLNGYPLSGERRETLEDGQVYTVQYFERGRMEHHPEHAAPHDVLLGQFGRRVLQAGDDFLGTLPTEPAPAQPGATYFAETGHNVAGRFLDYWRTKGGLAQFGYPLTETIVARLTPDGPEYTMQYFERARFEHHPENASPYDVLLGQFGRRILAEADLLADVPNFNRLYLVSERVQTQVGRPVAPAARAPGAFRSFEHGAMLWRGDTRVIYVLCGGDRRAGEDVRGPFTDTWRDGDAPGGGAGPGSGLYEPGRGFGKLWRENAEVRACLGHATDAVETPFNIVVQPFRRASFDNMLIAAKTPEGQFIYAVYSGILGSSSCVVRPALCRPDYERYPDPAR